MVVELHAADLQVAEVALAQLLVQLVEAAGAERGVEVAAGEMRLHADPGHHLGEVHRVAQRAPLDALVQHGADRHAEGDDQEQAQDGELDQQGRPAQAGAHIR
jgi:hypothetical protein